MVKNIKHLALATAVVGSSVVPMVALAANGTPSAGIGQIDATKKKAQLKVGKTYTSKDKGAQQFTFTMAFEEAKDDKGVAITSGYPAAAASQTISFSNADLATGSATKTAQFADMDFSSAKPGAYMYKVTETKGSASGVTYDESFYYVVIYVAYDVDENNNTLDTVHIQDITSWHNAKGENVKPPLNDLTTTQDSATGEKVNIDGSQFQKVDTTQFINEQEAQDVKIKKNVKGTLGRTAETFPATVAFTNLTPSTQYTITGDQTETPVASFTSGADGTATVNLTLKDNCEITVKDLPLGAKYTVTETNSKAHNPSYTVAGNGTDPTIASASGGSATTAATSLATSQETVDADDGTVTVTFDNTRTFKAVTGVPFAALPFAVAAIAGGVTAAVARRKKSSSDII